MLQHRKIHIEANRAEMVSESIIRSTTRQTIPNPESMLVYFRGYFWKSHLVHLRQLSFIYTHEKINLLANKIISHTKRTNSPRPNPNKFPR